MISAVGIKRILFADIDKVTADITPEIAKTLIQLVLVNLDIIDEYLETFHIVDDEFYK